MVTAATVAVKVALVAPAATVTLLGNVTALLLLASATVRPPVVAALESVTVHVSFRAPVTEVLLQETPVTVGAVEVPVPLRLTDALEALLEIVNCPVVDAALAGSNCTESTVVCPGFSVVGRLPPETENPVPEMESELSVSAAVPLEVTVTDLLTAVPTETFPKASDVALRVRAGLAAFSWSDTFCEEELELAVSVAVCAVVTDDTAAVKDAVTAPDATETLAGIVTAESLLERAMLWPPLCAAELSDTVQLVVAAPVKELVPQDKPDTVGAAVGEEIDVSGFNWIDSVFVREPRVAVRVTVCADVTEAMLAEKFALVAPEGMVTEAGTPIELLLLARLTPTPLLAA